MKSEMNAFRLSPRDVLFLRDARPMEASKVGHGTNSPLPHQLWYAFAGALIEHHPTISAAEKEKARQLPDHHYLPLIANLKTIGPFLIKTEKGEKQSLFLPTPLDLSWDEKESLFVPMTVKPISGTNLPTPLSHVFESTRIGKGNGPTWISLDHYLDYLQGKPLKASPLSPKPYEAQIMPGIGMDPSTQSVEEGKFYLAEYLRFHSDYALFAYASCPSSDPARQDDLLDHWLSATREEFGSSFIQMGGQGGILHVTPLTSEIPKLPNPFTQPNCLYLRWTLLTPAVFPYEPPKNGHKGHPGGWLPNWVNPETGDVLFPPPLKGQENLPRRVRRKDLQNQKPIAARLIAARIGKPLVFSGWSMERGPKPTHLAVPAGSCYIFECQTEADRDALCSALHGRPRSLKFGEKGYGIGICSTIYINKETC